MEFRKGDLVQHKHDWKGIVVNPDSVTGHIDVQQEGGGRVYAVPSDLILLRDSAADGPEVDLLRAIGWGITTEMAITAMEAILECRRNNG